MAPVSEDEPVPSTVSWTVSCVQHLSLSRDSSSFVFLSRSAEPARHRRLKKKNILLITAVTGKKCSWHRDLLRRLIWSVVWKKYKKRKGENIERTFSAHSVGNVRTWHLYSCSGNVPYRSTVETKSARKKKNPSRSQRLRFQQICITAVKHCLNNTCEGPNSSGGNLKVLQVRRCWGDWTKDAQVHLS